jgi:hypothetical protein
MTDLTSRCRECPTLANLQLSDTNKKSGLKPKMCGQLTVDRNITFTLKSVVSQLPSSEDVSTEAEEYPFLGAITRQHVVKTYKTLCVL